MKQTDKYLHVRAWGRLMGSYPSYVNGQVKKALRDNAPEDACFYSKVDKRWIKFSEIQSFFSRKFIGGEVEFLKRIRKGSEDE